MLWPHNDQCEFANLQYASKSWKIRRNGQLTLARETFKNSPGTVKYVQHALRSIIAKSNGSITIWIRKNKDFCATVIKYQSTLASTDYVHQSLVSGVNSGKRVKLRLGFR